MFIFLKFYITFRECQVLICTDVCGMGLDVKDLNFSVSIGKIFAFRLQFMLHIYAYKHFRTGQKLLEDEATVWSLGARRGTIN